MRYRVPGLPFPLYGRKRPARTQRKTGKLSGSPRRMNQKRLCEVQIPTCWKQWVTVCWNNTLYHSIGRVRWLSMSYLLKWLNTRPKTATLCPTEQNRVFAYSHVFQLPFQHLVQHGFYKNATVPNHWSSLPFRDICRRTWKWLSVILYCDQDQRHSNYGVFPLASLFNHSCAPNMCKVLLADWVSRLQMTVSSLNTREKPVHWWHQAQQPRYFWELQEISSLGKSSRNSTVTWLLIILVVIIIIIIIIMNL